jgi:serine/threonine protein kinase
MGTQEIVGAWHSGKIERLPCSLSVECYALTEDIGPFLNNLSGRLIGLFMSRVGQLIATRYLLLQLLDQGAMGEVYGARDMRLNTIVAVKFLKQALHSSEMCDRFWREAMVCAQLSVNSPYIVRVTDFGTDAANIPFLVMEYLQGLSLKQYLQARSLPLPQCSPAQSE